MTNPEQPPGPALIVFGVLPSEATPRAGWFPVEQAARAENAARVLGLLFLAIDSGELRTLASTLLEKGNLTSTGQLQLAAVSSEFVSDLVLRHRAKHTASLPRGPESGQGGPPLGHRPRSPIPKSLWDALTLTDVVLAAHLEDGEPAGWWEAVILNVRYGTYTLRWCDYPDEGLFRRQRKHIALLFPD